MSTRPMDETRLRDIWTALCERHEAPTKLIGDLWSEIHAAYTARSRHYHDLAHLADLITLLDESSLAPHHYDELLFTVYYHDIVYYVLQSDNELKSAALARRRLRLMPGMTSGALERIQQAIIATKGHQRQQDETIDLFLDFDISILAADKERYAEYCRQIRFEYAVIPERIFTSGRIRILRYYLQQEHIYHAEQSRARWEEKARHNIRQELESLTSVEAH